MYKYFEEFENYLFKDECPFYSNLYKKFIEKENISSK